MRTIRSGDGTRLAVEEAGGPGPLLVLANGLGGTMRAWDPLVARLAPVARLVSWDYRGLYGSAPPADPAAVSIDDHCRDLEAVLDDAGGGPAVLIGWSMGVQVAAEYALQHPADVAALVLICGAPGDPFAGVFHTRLSRLTVPATARLVEAAPGTFGRLLRTVTAPASAPGWLRRLGVLAPTADLDVFRRLSRDFARLDWAVYARTTRAMGRHDAGPRLHDITAPTLVIGGTRDLFTPVATTLGTAAAIPGAELVLLDGATHYAPVEFPDEISRRIVTFLEEENLCGGSALMAS